MRNHFHPYPYAERNKNTPGNRALDQETQHSSPVDQTPLVPVKRRPIPWTAPARPA
jgi:hypothetical protein